MIDDVMTEYQVSDNERQLFAEQIEQDISWLSAYGVDPLGGVTRLLYSDAWLSAQDALAERMKALGLMTYYDDCGNLYGRLEGRDSGLGTVLTGSHIDTVKCGGHYDGAYGILAGMAALANLRQRFGAPVRTLEVVSLCEEEGSRFPLTYWGSGNITGKYDVSSVPAITDSDGIGLKEAMEAAGFGLGRHRAPFRSDLAGYIELHIEQGAVLYHGGKSIGIVEGIVGQKRMTVEVGGLANHAGTTLMAGRQDALAGASEMIFILEAAAQQEGENFVATAGLLQVEPNLANVIPGKATFSVDVRADDARTLERFVAYLGDRFNEIAERRNLSITILEWMNTMPTRMDTDIRRNLAKICEARGLAYRTMYSGAGHDAQMFQAVCPTSMLFVPSWGGVSHSPLEYTPPYALAEGIGVLTEWLYRCGYKG